MVFVFFLCHVKTWAPKRSNVSFLTGATDVVVVVVLVLLFDCRWVVCENIPSPLSLWHLCRLAERRCIYLGG